MPGRPRDRLAVCPTKTPVREETVRAPASRRRVPNPILGARLPKSLQPQLA